jgi:hypothetical protein
VPIYILQEGQSRVFKIGLTRADDIDHRRDQLQTGNSRRLTQFDRVDAENESACETFFHRLLATRRVPNGGKDFFMMDSEQHMRSTIEQFRDMTARLENARAVAGELCQVQCTSILLDPTTEDRALLARLLEIKEEQEYLQFERELIEFELKKRIGHASGIRGVATWKTQVSRMYSEEIFRNSDPELYQELLERYYCLDTKAWKEERPAQYKEIQTTYFAPRTSRALKLQNIA